MVPSSPSHDHVFRFLQAQTSSSSSFGAGIYSNASSNSQFWNSSSKSLLFITVHIVLGVLFCLCYHFSCRRNRDQELERQQIEDSKFNEDPDHRRKRIQRYFFDCKCRMVVKEGDIIIGDIPNQKHSLSLGHSPNSTDSPTKNESIDYNLSKTIANGFSSVETLEKSPPISMLDSTSNDHPDVDLDIEACRQTCPLSRDPEEQQSENCNINLDEDELLRESGSLVLGGIKHYNTSKENTNNRCGTTVVNCCAICLCPYEVSDVVVWSDHESDCRHAFHEQCMLDWMCAQQQVPLSQHEISDDDNVHRRKRQQSRHTPCPMCRHAFLPALNQYYDGKYIKKENEFANPRTFNLGAISIR